MTTITGLSAAEYLASDEFKNRLKLHIKDNTDKLWSYKIYSGMRSEFAFDPMTKNGLYIWFDCPPPTVTGVVDIKELSRSSYSTALDRVFSGGLHKARYKATIQTKQALSEVISNLELDRRTSHQPNESWSTDELEAAVIAYVDMRRMEINKEPFTKKIYYEDLSKKFGRTAKSYEYRMQNISYVYSLMGRDWIPGLKPAKNVGAKIAGIIEELIHKAEGFYFSPVASFQVNISSPEKDQSRAQPVGNLIPTVKNSTVTHFTRSPEVVNWVLSRAKGICECCDFHAPFNRDDGTPFLEVHHLRRLTDGGSDTITNTIAVCPNCHRELHYGANRTQLLKTIYSKVTRLFEE
ncbi:MAG: HNH endonuclease [Candidatus Thiodiazotropha taylori]|nr:HNH endonuclease [Candidatus Thiodiazotropha taylori]